MNSESRPHGLEIQPAIMNQVFFFFFLWFSLGLAQLVRVCCPSCKFPAAVKISDMEFPFFFLYKLMLDSGAGKKRNDFSSSGAVSFLKCLQLSVISFLGFLLLTGAVLHSPFLLCITPGRRRKRELFEPVGVSSWAHDIRHQCHWRTIFYGLLSPHPTPVPCVVM